MPNTESTLSSMDSERFPTGPIIMSAATRFIGTLSCSKTRKCTSDKNACEYMNTVMVKIAVARHSPSRVFVSYVNLRALVENLENSTRYS